MEAIKTNILGTENILSSAEKYNVKKAIILSTDKAAYPINVMGMTKALMEKVMIAKSRDLDSTNTIFCGTRYGNVMASRGSVIPLFINQIKQNKPITLTSGSMTRFMMTLDNAVNLVLFAFENGRNGDIFVQKSPAVAINVLANALKEIYNSPVKINEIGVRHGEKMYETLVTKEEMIKADDLGDYYRFSADNRDLNYEKYFSKGTDVKKINEYNSNTTEQLDLNSMKKLLLKLPEIQSDLNN